MRILSVTHSPLARAELFGDVVRDEGHELVEWEIVSRGRPPANAFAAVMVFGGDMNVGEELAHPWLHDEYELLREWVAAGTPLLGVCLGAQTLAHALGGRVARVDEPLAGFYETELTDAGAADPVLGALPRRFEAFNGNAYAFEVPAHATELAQGPVPQAFRAGERAWGVQFHPEVQRDQVLRWWQDEELPRPVEELRRELDAKIGGWQELGRRLCRAFLSAATR
jgi:GMP synthase (glutamine-hydrolysing)